jgi:hypothetical protein
LVVVVLALIMPKAQTVLPQLLVVLLQLVEALDQQLALPQILEVLVEGALRLLILEVLEQQDKVMRVVMALLLPVMVLVEAVVLEVLA